ncbi:hypothetical protein UT300007_22430 [Clostridium sp. CTA-7]
MKGKFLNISIFVLSIISLIISTKLFWNIAIYSDEFNTSPDIILGGEFWLNMNWLMLGFITFICVLSGISLLIKNEK